jgi:hypothetical protein
VCDNGEPVATTGASGRAIAHPKVRTGTGPTISRTAVSTNRLPVVEYTAYLCSPSPATMSPERNRE